MASKKKHSEGIALLSVYSDDDDDEEMEDAEQRNERIDEDDHLEESNFMDEEERARGEDSTTPNVLLDNGASTDSPSRVNFESDDTSGESNDTLLDQFLSPPSRDKCSEELQRKIDKFLSLKKMGKSFNNEVRNRKEYRNPDFLLHAVSYQDIDQTGSCFNIHVFDPSGYDPSDFCDALEVDMKNERERKEQESKKNQMFDFVSAGPQPGSVFAAPKPNIPVPPGVPALASSELPSIPTETAARDGRPNRKSKWDKVDEDVQNPPPLAPLVSGASAGSTSGYSAYANQRRREVEGRRSAESKLERRS